MEDYDLVSEEFFNSSVPLLSPSSLLSLPLSSPQLMNTEWTLSLPLSSSQLMNTEWTFEEDKVFENAIAEFDVTSVDFFEKIGSKIPGKTVDQIKEHYETLIVDVEKIELGVIPLPDYVDDSNKKSSTRGTSSARQRKKGVAWTKEEHENFLAGLATFGKGDWKSISRVCVQTRSPTQVASHAQKHFLRLQKEDAQKTRSKPSTSKPNKA